MPRTDPAVPTLEKKEALGTDTFRMITALESMDHVRRHRQIQREAQQQWRATVCNAVFLWWRTSVASFSKPVPPTEVEQIQSTYMDQLLGTIDQVLKSAPTLDPEVDKYVRTKSTTYGVELYKCWLKYVTPRPRRHYGPVVYGPPTKKVTPLLRKNLVIQVIQGGVWIRGPIATSVVIVVFSTARPSQKLSGSVRPVWGTPSTLKQKAP
jgi:hypothetical protein